MPKQTDYIGNVEIISLFANKQLEGSDKIIKGIVALIEDHGGDYPDFRGSSSTIYNVTYSAKWADVELLSEAIAVEYPQVSVHFEGESTENDGIEADVAALVIEVV